MIQSPRPIIRPSLFTVRDDRWKPSTPVGKRCSMSRAQQKRVAAKRRNVIRNRLAHRGSARR